MDAPLQGSADAATATTGFKLNLGSSYVSTKPVTISAAKTSGVYAGYFQAQSDPASVPGISVHIHASNAELSSGMQVLAREHHVELVVARLAAHAGEPVRENAAPQILGELALHVARQPGTPGVVVACSANMVCAWPATSSCGTVRSGIRRRYAPSGCPAAPDVRS